MFPNIHHYSNCPKNNEIFLKLPDDIKISKYSQKGAGRE